MRRVWSLSVVAFLSTTPQLRAAVDFLIVENTDRLRVYNKYQQEASTKDRQSVVPFAPIRILKANEMLGDGYTSCMQVDIDGQIFYLLTSEDGSLSSSGPLGFEKLFHNATVLVDTIRILTDHSIRWSPTGFPARYLSTNESVLRVFRHRNATYGRLLTSPHHFGWIDIPERKEGKDWNVLRTIAPTTSSVTPPVAQRIRARVHEVNRVFAHLFAYFNEQTGQNKQPPQWSIETSRKALICALRGAGEETFAQSTFYLVNDIENIVLGSGFQVAHRPGRIEILQK